MAIGQVGKKIGKMKRKKKKKNKRIIMTHEEYRNFRLYHGVKTEDEDEESTEKEPK